MPYVDIILRIGTSTLPWHLHNFESGAILLNVYLTYVTSGHYSPTP